MSLQLSDEDVNNHGILRPPLIRYQVLTHFDVDLAVLAVLQVKAPHVLSDPIALPRKSVTPFTFRLQCAFLEAEAKSVSLKRYLFAHFHLRAPTNYSPRCSGAFVHLTGTASSVVVFIFLQQCFRSFMF
eukprot:scaffold2294_cov106-Cylindrotheca_fusiformis.AAC.3